MPKILVRIRALLLSIRVTLEQNPIFNRLFQRIKYNPIALYLLKKKLSQNGLESELAESKKTILIPLIESNHDQILVVLTIAKSLELRGHTIHLILCGGCLDACEIRNVRNDNKHICNKCHFKRKNILSLFGFKTFLLSEIIDKKDIGIKIDSIMDNFSVQDEEFLFNGLNIKTAIFESVTRYYYGGWPKTEKDLNEHILKNLDTYLKNFFAIDYLHQTHNYDIVFNNMRVYSTWQPYYDYAEINQIESASIHGSFFDSSKLVMNLSELLTSDIRYKKYLKFRGPKKLTTSENQELDKFLEKRFSGKSNPLFLDIATMGRTPENYKDLKLSNKKRKVFLFTNLFWDLGMSGQSGTFKNNADWCIHTINLLANNPKIDLYIKTHPLESFDVSLKNSRGIADIIYDKFPKLPKNVFLIDRNYKVNSYDLFPFIDLGVVFSGTLGLEMLLSKLKVINIGQASYNAIPNFVNPSSIGEYEKILLGELPIVRLDDSDIRLFAYFYFIKSLIPFKPIDSVSGLQFNDFNFSEINELMPGNDYHLDHIAKSILDSKSNSPENY